MGPGEKLGHYEILAFIGEGGMGRVYRARDPRLNRDVAIKVSAAEFNERFEREARAIAALNHPNICQIYDVGPNFLVMELVEGTSLQGPLPLETALRFAQQIGDALEAAHEKGIVHRDLKPSNIRITPDGVVKLLDFGLAKHTPETEQPVDDNSPTMNTATQSGMILGTAGYMSPEQARGKRVDKRTDIWAFGVVLYEMLTGTRLFKGEDVTEIIAAVVLKEPDLSGVPIRVQRLLRKCLEKDPKKRLRDIGDAWALLEETSEATVAKAPGLASRLSWIVASLFVVTTIAFAALYLRQQPLPDPEQVTRLELSLNAQQMELSPDGRILTYSAQSNGKLAIWVRPLDSNGPGHLLQGTEGNNASWFFSPDSRFIAFTKDGELKKVAIAGGPPTTILKSDLTIQVRGGSWNRDDILIFGSPFGIVRVALADGNATLITTVVADQELDHIYPVFLPDGRHFLYLRSLLNPLGAATLYSGDLNKNPQEQSGQVLASANGGGPPNHLYYFASQNPRAASAGVLVFRRDLTVVAQPFDPAAGSLVGSAVPVSEGPVETYAAAPGLIVYRTDKGGGGFKSQLTWYDRNGKPGAHMDAAAAQDYLKISPDGKQVAVERYAPASAIWVWNIERNNAIRLTSRLSMSPVWSPDSSQVLFATFGTENGKVTTTTSSAKDKKAPALPFALYLRSADGAGADSSFLNLDSSTVAVDWSKDGFILLNRFTSTGQSGLDFIRLKEGKVEGEPTRYLDTAADEKDAALSPNGQWVAYTSNDSGKAELYVSSFPNAERSRTHISSGAAAMPHWNHDNELLYVSPPSTIMSVSITAGAGLQATKEKSLFTVPGTIMGWDIAPDGRFLLNVSEQSSSASAGSFTTEKAIVVSHWQSALRN